MDRMQAEQIVTAQLDPGERILWSGFPAPGALARRVLPMTLFGIPFTAFSVFWVWQTLSITRHGPQAPGPLFLLPLFGLPVLFVGLGVMASPIWVYLAAKSTVYAVTEKRALIIAGTTSRGIQSFTREDLSEISRVERADGTGSVYFATRTVARPSSGITRLGRVGFEGIPDVRQVEQLLRDLMERKAA